MASGPDCPRGEGDSRETRLADSIQEVVVARYDGQPEAEMWAELLRNEGIAVAVIQLAAVRKSRQTRLTVGSDPGAVRVRNLRRGHPGRQLCFPFTSTNVTD